MERIRTSSTSASTADADPIELRSGTTSRLVFKPVIVWNTSDPEASVDGCLLWQRKGPKDSWVDVREVSLNSLRKGEGYALELHASELLKLHRGLTALYSIHRSHGVPIGDRTFVPIEATLERVLGLDDNDLAELPAASRGALGRLMRWAARRGDMKQVLAELAASQPEAIPLFAALAGVSALRSATMVWQQHRTNDDEEFWQRTLVQHPILLEQLFAYPVVIVKDKAYVGGKSVENIGGNIADFLFKNRITHNAALVEIKTPATPLLGGKYRNRTYNISTELSGAIMQALTNRKSLAQQLDSLTRGLVEPLDSCEPDCLVIAGTAEAELTSAEKKQAFGLFRRQFQGVQVITFDELFTRTERLVQLLERDQTTEPLTALPAEEPPGEDIAF